MKKLLLCSAAACGLVMSAAPAHAQFEATLGGHFKGYFGYVSQDTQNNVEERNLDIFRETELDFNFELIADNGLTFGAQIEIEADTDDNFSTDESYGYVSGFFGRVNFGGEDGAGYLMQVNAPSADSNVDGIRTYIDPVSLDISDVVGNAGANAATIRTLMNGEGIDYDMDLGGLSGSGSEKITYFTPVFQGFQLGASYTPEANDNGEGTRDLFGTNQDDVNNDFGSIYEVAVRYEGQFNNVGLALGGGFASAELEDEVAGGARDDRQAWNVGLDLDIGPFGVGAAYTEDDNGYDDDTDTETFVVGADYTVGAFQFGASVLMRDIELDGITGANSGEVETDRYSGGVIYTVTPGVTARGSINFVDHDVPAAVGSDTEATYVLGGMTFSF